LIPAIVSREHFLARIRIMIMVDQIIIGKTITLFLNLLLAVLKVLFVKDFSKTLD